MINGLPLVNQAVLENINLITLFGLFFRLRHSCRVVGNSMEPSIKEGDLIIYKPIRRRNFDLDEGNIIVLIQPGIEKRKIIKRIFKKSSFGFDVRGDNPLSSIDSRQFGLIDRDSIVGLVESIIKYS